MSHGKRTKKDVADAYRRGFEAGFNVRPNPVAMILRSIWRKHELKKLKKAWQEEVKKGGINSAPIGFVKKISEDENGISAEIVIDDPDLRREILGDA